MIDLKCQKVSRTFLTPNLNEPDSYLEIYRCKCGQDLIAKDDLERHKVMFDLESMVITCCNCDKTTEIE